MSPCYFTSSTKEWEDENTSNLEDWANFDALYIVAACYIICYIDTVFYNNYSSEFFCICLLQTVSWRFLCNHRNKPVLMIGEKSAFTQSINTLPCENADKLTSEAFVYRGLHWALYHVWFQNIFELYILMNEAMYMK